MLRRKPTQSLVASPCVSIHELRSAEMSKSTVKVLSFTSAIIQILPVSPQTRVLQASKLLSPMVLADAAIVNGGSRDITVCLQEASPVP
jgi:hypothetical protein